MPKPKEPAAAISSFAREKLDALFRRDIERTAALTGLDLSDWLEPGYAEPMQSDGWP